MTQMNNDKDIKRYSYSRISTYKQCPRKHYYLYVEQIQAKQSPYVIPGKLFHQAVEYTLKGLDVQPVYDEFVSYCRTGVLDMEPDTLEYVVNLYFNYYHKDYTEEKNLMVEKEFNDDLDDEGNYLTMIVDQAFEKDNNIYIRDIKTTANALKYTMDDVVFNQQLLLYLPYVEAELGQPVNAIQIDEVRIAKLKEVPLKANGKPVADKRLLSLVTYEAYLQELQDQGLENDKEYQATLEYLEQRGHPLFNRVTVQILDQNIVSSNAQDFIAAFNSAKTMADYRVKGPLCQYCSYCQLCKLDYSNPDTQSRQQVIDRIENF